MINGKAAIAIIPARGGSKGLPGKNIRPLCGKPLLAWTVEKALKSQLLDTVLVSTDSPAIAEVAAQSGAAVPFLRPEALATDEAPTLAVVRHALEFYRTQEGREFDYVVLLEPTSPLREDGDIDAMLRALDAESDAFDAVVSVGRVNEHPSIMKRVVGNRMMPFFEDVVAATRRQDNVPAYFPYGVAYIVKTHTLVEEESFYPRRCRPYLIKRYQNYEIDDLYDFLCIEAVMKHEWGLS